MSSRIYIGRLSYKANEDDISDFFRGFGRIREILLKNGYGFVEFDDHRDADDAVYELNGKELMGERIQIEIARGRPHPRDSYRDRDRDRGYSRRDSRGGGGGRRGGGGRDKYGPPTRTDYRLIVENLSSRVSWQDLKDYMRQAGDVTYADAHKQRRNEGTVEFASYSDMKNALEKLDGTDIDHKPIKLREDKRRSRRRSRSWSRSRSRSRRRSRSRSRSPRSRSRSRKRSRSHSRKRSRSHSRKRSHSKSRSRSRGRGRASKSRSGSRSRSRSPHKRSSRSKSRSKSRSRSRSRSKSKDKERERSKSRSASPGPAKNCHDDSDKGGD